MRWNNYRYKIEKNEVILTQYEGEEDAICIPKQIDGMPVTEIGTEAFSEYGAALSRIEVPGTVKKIGDGAFKMCMSLTELVLHEGLEEIGEDVFLFTPLTALFLPVSVRSIGKIWELGEIEWEVDPDSPHFFSDGYGLYHRCADRCELVVALLKREAVSYQVLPGTTGIGRGAFAGHEELEEIHFPDSLRYVGEDAFESCQNLREVGLNEGLERLGADAFSHCVNLKKIHLPSTLCVMEENALTNTFGWSDAVNGIASVTVASDNPYFSADCSALYERKEDGSLWLLKYFGTERRFVIPDTVSVVGTSAFRRALVREIKIPASVQMIGHDAFRECKQMETVELPDAVKLYVPRTPVYRKDEIMELLEGGEFDFDGYDNLFETYLDLYEQCGMACSRLRYPVSLSCEREACYREFLKEHLDEIVEVICQREDLERLSVLAELGCFSETNMDDCMDIVNRSGKTKLLSFLMNYKQENIQGETFDFSL